MDGWITDVNYVGKKEDFINQIPFTHLCSIALVLKSTVEWGGIVLELNLLAMPENSNFFESNND